MKRILLVSLLCLSMVMSFTGCSKKSDVELDTWSVVGEKEYTFPTNCVGYYDADNAISVGANGEIHYYNSSSDWRMAENNSVCRYGMDIVDDSVCYTCGNAGQITKSTDGGKTFIRMTDFGNYTENACRLMSFCDKETGIIAAPKRLAITTDGAQTWTELIAPTEIIAIKMLTVLHIQKKTFLKPVL